MKEHSWLICVCIFKLFVFLVTWREREVKPVECVCIWIDMLNGSRLQKRGIGVLVQFHSLVCVMMYTIYTSLNPIPWSRNETSLHFGLGIKSLQYGNETTTTTTTCT